MENISFTSTAEIPTLRGADYVDALYSHELQTASTVSEVRDSLQEIVMTVGTDGEMGQRATELRENFETATHGGHENIRLEDDLGAGVLGQNMVGTNNSEVRRDQFSPEAITENARHTLDTVLHENSTELGHAGQDARATSTISVIDEQGVYHNAVTVLEGNVVSNVSDHIGERREGLPQEAYLDGANLVESIGNDTVDDYVRIGGSKTGEFLQVEVWKQQPAITLEKMFEQGAAVGMSEDEVLVAAKKLGKISAESERMYQLSA